MPACKAKKGSQKLGHSSPIGRQTLGDTFCFKPFPSRVKEELGST